MPLAWGVSAKLIRVPVDSSAGQDGKCGLVFHEMPGHELSPPPSLMLRCLKNQIVTPA